MERLFQLVAILVYVLLARVALGLRRRELGRAIFAAINVLGVTLLLLWDFQEPFRRAVARAAVYVSLIGVHYVLMRRMQSGRASWPAILYPLGLLLVFKYSRVAWEPIAMKASLPIDRIQHQVTAFAVGISYLAFRLSHFAVEVRGRAARMPTLSEHLSFAFLLPTMSVGPISPGSTFLNSLDTPSQSATPIGRAMLRIIVGATKYLFISSVLVHLTYRDLLGDGHPHASAIDWITSAVAYYLYLYCNFSGFCDMAIGLAGLLGISVVENFNVPLIARNPKDYWNRWHISLSNYIREMFFSPVSKILARRLGPGRVNEAIAGALVLTFVAVGVWHGVGVNFLLFGLIHACGMVVHHYYTVFLRKHLSRESLRRYQASVVVHAVSVLLTFGFVTASFFVFANDLPQIRELVHVNSTLPEREFLWGLPQRVGPK